MIKYLSVVVSAAALFATPALASSAHHKGKASATDSYASSNVYDPAHSRDAVVSSDGKVLGADPDPNIQFQLLRDQNLAN
jgi:hypothetical protein